MLGMKYNTSKKKSMNNVKEVVKTKAVQTERRSKRLETKFKPEQNSIRQTCLSNFLSFCGFLVFWFAKISNFVTNF
jgi:hypothetical protein